MKTKLFLIAILSIGVAGFSQAQTSASSSSSATTTTAKSGGMPFTEGTVWTLTLVKTKTGLEDEYLRQISGTVKPVYAEMKKENVILDYKILTGDAVGRDDFNIMIMVEYPNMAALDGLREKTDPILEKVMGAESQRQQMAVKRLDVREILATKTMREITLK